LDEEIRVLAGNSFSFFGSKVLHPLICLDVDFDILEPSICGCEFVSVTAVGIHVAQGRGCSPVTEQMHELVESFWISRVEAVTVRMLPKYRVLTPTPRTMSVSILSLILNHRMN